MNKSYLLSVLRLILITELRLRFSSNVNFKCITNSVIHWVVSLSAIIAVRVPKELKKKIEELKIEYSKEIRKFLEELVRRETIRRVVAKALEIQKKIGRIKGNTAAEFVREDRDER